MSFFRNLAIGLDRKKYGQIFGFIVPLITFLLIWAIKFNDMSIGHLISVLAHNSNMRNILILPIIPNLILFYFSNFRLKLNSFTLGIVVPTIFYAILIAIVVILM